MQGWAWSAPPYPFNWFWYRQDIAWYFSPTVGTNSILLDDRLIDYDYIAAQKSQASAAAQTSQSTGDGGGGGGTENGPGPWPPPYYATNLWLEIAFSANVQGTADLILHGTTNGFYQLLFKDSLRGSSGSWSLSQIQENYDGTNTMYFGPVPLDDPRMRFYRAVSGEAWLSVRADNYQYGYANPVIEPCSSTESNTPDRFVVSIHPRPLDHDLAVVYTLSGSAENGIDYTFLPSTVVISNNTSEAYIYVNALYDSLVEFEEQVKLSLVLTNGYLVDPEAPSATLPITDCATNWFQVVATNIAGADLDWYAPSNWLVVSASDPWTFAAYSNYFVCLFPEPVTNGPLVMTNLVVTNWSGLVGMGDEVKIATVRSNTYGWSLGETFCAPDVAGTVGWISADATAWTNNWLTIPGESNLLRGSLYFDQTGIWGGDLIAASGESNPLTPGMNVWRINRQTNATLLAHLPAKHLEGIITLPNDSRYGPWAGKLVTADESTRLFYAIDTNGVAVSYDLGIDAGDIDLIATNQDLYCNDPKPYGSGPPCILKIPSMYFTNYWGHVVSTQAGEFQTKPNITIIQWNDAATNFVLRTIPYTGEFLEHATFAPVNLAPLQ